MVKTKSVTVSLTVEEFTKENLALALHGSYQLNPGSTVTKEPLASGSSPVIRDRYFLAYAKVSNFVLKDNSVTPLTLQSGADCMVDLDFVAIHFLRLNNGAVPPVSFMAPLKASYGFGAVAEVGIFTQPLPERFLRLESINTAQNNAKVPVELYRLALRAAAPEVQARPCRQPLEHQTFGVFEELQGLGL